ncbi:unnamed protein product, partial [Closterium sp. NIES-53]
MTRTKAGGHGRVMGLRHLMPLVLAVALAVLPPSWAAVEAAIVTDPAEVEVLRAVRDGITNAVEWLPHWADEFDPCGPLGWTPEIICNISDSGAATVTSISLRAGLVGSLSPQVLRLPNLESLVLGQVSFNATALLPIINGLTHLKQLALMSTALNYRASQLALANMTRLQDLTLQRIGLSGRLSDLHLPLMPSLLRIDLSMNSLTGEIPQELASHPFSH